MQESIKSLSKLDKVSFIFVKLLSSEFMFLLYSSIFSGVKYLSYNFLTFFCVKIFCSDIISSLLAFNADSSSNNNLSKSSNLFPSPLSNLLSKSLTESNLSGGFSFSLSLSLSLSFSSFGSLTSILSIFISDIYF